MRARSLSGVCALPGAYGVSWRVRAGSVGCPTHLHGAMHPLVVAPTVRIVVTRDIPAGWGPPSRRHGGGELGYEAGLVFLRGIIGSRDANGRVSCSSMGLLRRAA